MENPWATPAGVRAQQARTAQLAAGSGEVADFAREVVAGRASSRDLLCTSALSDRALQPVRDLVERWHRLSPAERARVEAEAATAVEDRIAALNTLPTEPPAAESPEPRWSGRSRPSRRPGDDPDPDEGRTFLSDAW
ncbi:hypothetical protein [Saccharothrix variisporea]|uniref:hypothetical protein n=1 Tax=Saccharothrix variisporea TaxID=543527 RepID=UPI000EAFBA64|nr:hypothetical protein [Saccharothrix variisporea]